MRTKTKIFMIVDEVTKDDEFVKTCRCASRISSKTSADITFKQIIFSSFNQLPENSLSTNYLFIIPYNMELIPSIILIPYIKQRYKNVLVSFIISSNNKDYVDKLMRYDVDNIFIKPVNIPMVSKSIEILINNFIIEEDVVNKDLIIAGKKDNYDRLSVRNLKKDINILLRKMTFKRRKYKGYKYTVYAIIECINCMGSGNRIYMTKKIYPNVAKKFGSTGTNVEHTIRTYIEKLFDEPNEFTIENFIEPYGLEYRPSNGEFINLIAEGFIEGWIYEMIGKEFNEDEDVI